MGNNYNVSLKRKLLVHKGLDSALCDNDEVTVSVVPAAAHCGLTGQLLVANSAGPVRI